MLKRKTNQNQSQVFFLWTFRLCDGICFFSKEWADQILSLQGKWLSYGRGALKQGLELLTSQFLVTEAMGVPPSCRISLWLQQLGFESSLAAWR